MRKYLAILLFLLGATSVSAQHTYYISKSLGSDSNTAKQAQSKSTPWAHLPGMPSCTSNCVSYTPVPGDRFILYGGDTWTASDLGVNWQWSGTSNFPIYVGIDQTWFTGALWTRPIFNCQNTQRTINLGGWYMTFDNIEITGFRQTVSSGNGAVILTGGNYIEIARVYIHNFSAATTTTHSNAIANQCCGNGGIGTYIHDNVIDGSDSQQTFMGGILHGATVANNIIRYVYNGMNGAFNDVHGNLVENNYASADGDHANMIFIQGPLNGNIVKVYNNVIRHKMLGVTLWLAGLSCGSHTGYAFNNVIYDGAPGNTINPPGNVGGCSTPRTWYVFNNTVECGNDSNTGVCFSDSGDVGQADVGTVNFINNHWITSASPFFCAVLTCSSTTNLKQTVAAAKTRGYTSSQSQAFSPTTRSGSTTGKGTNGQPICAAISLIDSEAGTACLNATGYACTYNISDHTVSCPAKPLAPRPAGAWDIGAYQ